MGGDGGVIASNRKYMRGAGTADHTGDASRNASDKESEKEVMQELMALCYLTKQPLVFQHNSIVVDPYGRLYNKEAAVEALLRRSGGASGDELGSHVRGLKDLKTLNFELVSSKPTCPITSVELNGVNTAVLISQKKEGVNVLSERAIKEMGKEALQEEYGDLTDLIRLAPPPSLLKEVQERVKEQHEKEKLAKQEKKGKKNKRKKGHEIEDKKKKIKAQKSGGVTDAARQRVQSAVKGNDVLSSLFTKHDNKLSEKQRADNLFALNT